MTITSAQTPIPDRQEPRRGEREPLTYARRRQARASHPRRRSVRPAAGGRERFIEELEVRARRIAVRELKRGARTILGEDRSLSLQRFGLLPPASIHDRSEAGCAIVIEGLRHAVRAGQSGIAAGRWSACPVRLAGLRQTLLAERCRRRFGRRITGSC
jgi:hypothetical protein